MEGYLVPFTEPPVTFRAYRSSRRGIAGRASRWRFASLLARQHRANGVVIQGSVLRRHHDRGGEAAGGLLRPRRLAQPSIFLVPKFYFDEVHSRSSILARSITHGTLCRGASIFGFLGLQLPPLSLNSHGLAHIWRSAEVVTNQHKQPQAPLEAIGLKEADLHRRDASAPCSRACGLGLNPDSAGRWQQVSSENAAGNPAGRIERQDRG
jgi:hypothetical protein